MYEPTPECPKAAEAGLPVTPSVTDSAGLPFSVPLVASRRLRQLMAVTLLAFAVLPAITLWPHLSHQPAWLLPLVGFWGLVVLGARELRAWVRGFPGSLSWQGGVLWLEFNQRGVASVQPAERAGEALVWSWLLVVPFRLSATGQRYILVCLPDSAERDALRRLRVGLRTNLC